MGRLVEIKSVQSLPPRLTIGIGDLLIFRAAGGHITSGEGILEILGPFMPGLILEDGTILSPMGAPNAVAFFARHPGQATIDVVTGDPWHSPQTARLEITVEP
jgi:hypothetical protein